MTTPFNLALHEHLLALGYEHERMGESYAEIGDGESGPELEGGPAYDVYRGSDEYVYSSAGGILDRTARDLALEAWLDEHEAGGTAEYGEAPEAERARTDQEMRDYYGTQNFKL
jgi:hypothetical protein